MRGARGLLSALCLAVAVAAGHYSRDLTVDAEPVATAAPRSGSWRTARAAHLKLHPGCAVCSRRDEVEVHHVEPFSQRPELELDPGNLITLCRPCHFSFGHLWRWTRANPRIRADAAEWAARRVQK